jgi:chromosome segregation ATPase
LENGWCFWSAARLKSTMPREKSESAMDASETRQRLDWLDQERQRDKALLAELQKRVDQQEAELAHAQEATESLSETVSRGLVEAQRVSRFEEGLQQFKEEVMLELRKAEERLAKDSQSADTHLLEERRERQSALARLEQRIEDSLRLEDTLRTQRVDVDRLAKTAAALGAQIEESVKEGRKRNETLLALEGRIRRNEERTAELLQAREVAGTRSDEVVESLKLVQTKIERLFQQISDLEASREEVRKEHAAVAEQLRGLDDRVKKQIAAWSKQMGQWRGGAEELRERVALSDKQLRSGEKMLASLHEMSIQLEQDRESIQHVERTAEERQRQQLEEWRQENALLWLRNDEMWEQLAAENAKRDGHIRGLWEAQLSHLRREVGGLEKLMKDLGKRLTRL